jgi:hypothetical protein
MSRASSSPMEQGELEASPDLQHSPRILVELGDSDSHADFLFTGGRSGDKMKGGQEDTQVSSPERLTVLIVADYLQYMVPPF